MLESVPVAAAVGTALGFLSGLGVGGGSLLILWLTLVLGMEHSAARGINLVFFLPSAAIACFFRWRQGKLEPKLVLPGILAGCLGALIFSRLGTHLELRLVKKLFGGLLLFTGIRELCYKPKS